MTIGVAAWIWNWSSLSWFCGRPQYYRHHGADERRMRACDTRLDPRCFRCSRKSHRLRSGLMCGDPQGLHKAGASAASGTLLDHSQAILSPLFRANSIE